MSAREFVLRVIVGVGLVVLFLLCSLYAILPYLVTWPR
jgi:hypothetical protein